MRQFDVYENPDESMRRLVPYVIVLRHDRFAALPSVLVAPILVEEAAKRIEGLHPEVVIDGRRCFVDVTDPAAIAARHLVRRIGPPASEHDRLLRALDMLFCGY